MRVARTSSSISFCQTGRNALASAQLSRRSRRLAGTRTHASSTATGRTGVEAGKSVEVVDAEVVVGVAADGGKRRKVFTPPTVTASLVRVDV